MTPVATIIVPIAPHHADISEEALASARAQTVPCEVVRVLDVDRHGAGWARNTGAAQAHTPFVVFLDADDVLHPQFIQRCLSAYRPGVFVYSDWLSDDGRTVRLPNCTSEDGWYENRTFHLVTTLLPTALFRYIGGFNETLTAMEDTDLYLRLHAAGICGIRCAEPLVTYRTRRGQRARAAVESGEYTRLKASFHKQYGSVKNMGCCGGTTTTVAGSPGERQMGDVLASALWAGNRTEGSWYSARTYRGGNGKVMWVDRRDVMARPHLWQMVQDPQNDQPAIDEVLELAREVL